QVYALALGEESSFAVAQDFITEVDQEASQVHHASAHYDQVVVLRWSLVAALHLGDWQVITILLHLAIRVSQRAEQFYAAYFHPDDEVGVVHHPHLIGFRVAHAEAGFDNDRV